MKKLLIIIGLVAALGIIMLSAVKATSQPTFCVRCHELAPAVESWEKYSHQAVTCLECHADPGAIGVIKRKVGAYKEIYLHFFGEENREMEAKVNFENCVLCHTGKRASKYPQARNITKGNEALVGVHKDILAGKISCLNCHRETAHGNLD